MPNIVNLNGEQRVGAREPLPTMRCAACRRRARDVLYCESLVRRRSAVQFRALWLVSGYECQREKTEVAIRCRHF